MATAVRTVAKMMRMSVIFLLMDGFMLELPPGGYEREDGYFLTDYSITVKCYMSAMLSFVTIKTVCHHIIS
jgi:hypothetical protein